MRPIGPWPGERRGYYQRIEAPFRHVVTRGTGEQARRSSERMPLADTLELLRRELEAIGCTEAVVEADVREQDLRLDGWPKSGARVGGEPGVILRVLQSERGPLTMPCDRFTTWHDNLRGIALALEALRKVDRYGVTQRGEQYAGWKAIPASTGPTLTTEAAAGILAFYLDGSMQDRTALAQMILRSPEQAKRAGLRALQMAHPDKGGGRAEFEEVQLARAVLASHHGAVT